MTVAQHFQLAPTPPSVGGGGGAMAHMVAVAVCIMEIGRAIINVGYYAIDRKYPAHPGDK